MSVSTDEIEELLACACPSPIDIDAFRKYALWLLINIANGTSGGGSTPTDVSWIETERVPFGSVTGAYVVAMSDTSDKVFVEIQNNTDQEISVSFGGTVEHIVLPANNSFRLDPGSQNRVIPQAIYIKHTGTAPAVGEVVISAYA